MTHLEEFLETANNYEKQITRIEEEEAFFLGFIARNLAIIADELEKMNARAADEQQTKSKTL